MKFLLTAEPFGAAEALRIGLVQEVVPRDKLIERATSIAQKIASQAPLGVRATLASAHTAFREGPDAAIKALRGRWRCASWGPTTPARACSRSSSDAPVNSKDGEPTAARAGYDFMSISP
jgi:hypothetical protein